MESILAQSDESKAFVKELCFEYAHEAASLWHARAKAVCAPHYNLSDLLELDCRLEAQMDALRTAGETGWEAAIEQMKPGLPEYGVTPSILAFESNNEERIGMILDKAQADRESGAAVITALGWPAYEQVHPHIKKLLASNSTAHQYIGVAASAFHRRDPGFYLENAFYSTDATLKARSLKAMGELGGREDKLMPGRLRDQFKTEDPASRFWAMWSAVLLGDASALDRLKSYALDFSNSFSEEALQLLLRRLDLKDTQALHRELAERTDAERPAVIGAGIIGDPVLIPWLMGQMTTPALARVAGESFTLITGVNLGGQALEGPRPEGFESGPNDNLEDDNVAADPDENLPWPDVEKIAAWWDKNKAKYKPAMRHLLGEPITKDHLQHILRTGLQRQRAAAALELALLEPGTPLYNTGAPARRQLPEAPKAQNIAAPPNYGKRPLAVTAVNCITPVGHNAVMTAAAVRAGVTRFKIDEDYNDQNGNAVTVSKINGVRDGIKNVMERIRDIAKICLTDMLNAYSENIKQRPPHVHLLLGVASEERPGPDYGKENILVLKPVVTKRFGDHASEMITHGNASFHYAVEQAAKIIEEQADLVCIVGGVDCLLHESVLDGFESEGRLKSSGYGRNHGLIPSEAVSFLIVEDLERARQASRPILAKISTLGLSREPAPRSSGVSGICGGLSEACHKALEPLREQRIETIFSDLNGEEARAREWSVTRIRCFSGEREQPSLLCPAEYYGDIGAASGTVMACIAAQGFERNWLSKPVMMICSDDHGSCGAVILEKENLP